MSNITISKQDYIDTLPQDKITKIKVFLMSIGLDTKEIKLAMRGRICDLEDVLNENIINQILDSY